MSESEREGHTHTHTRTGTPQQKHGKVGRDNLYVMVVRMRAVSLWPTTVSA
jgi:hypothetical protein